MKCCKCKVELNESNGYIRTDKNKRSNPFQSLCRKCFNEYCCKRWNERKLEAIKLKGGKCEICGYNKYYGALEFHHRDPKSKEFSWKCLVEMKWERVLKELEKCSLLCSNCHREVHGGVSGKTSNLVTVAG
jgi:predicted HNH restriction endonuclease